ncbi:MAG: 30S ribosomal protein S2 [Chitinophagaceae bacterium]|nr:30S ribosomal protein S2 [Chitinophagaceae bacterium]
MINIEYKNLLEAGVHFGHLTQKWDPRMAPYIFMKKNGIHIIDLNKTIQCLEVTSQAIKNIVTKGGKIMFVATKKQAKALVVEEAEKLKMPYVTERWIGGMLTNFTTVRKSLKKLQSIEKTISQEQEWDERVKKEKNKIKKDQEKLKKTLGGIATMTRLPAALFVIDIKNEHIAIKEARKLKIPIFAIVDTNVNPNDVDFPIPGNDDAFKSIQIIIQHISNVIQETIQTQKNDKEAYMNQTVE